MPNYQNGKIYKLWSPSKNLVYYGSTVQSLSRRLSEHIRHNKNQKKCISYLITECEDYKIELLEEYPCNNKQQLERKEGEYQKNNECVNAKIAGRTKSEYYQDNKEKINKINNKYHQDNIEKIKEQKKIYSKLNGDIANDRSKEYYKENIDKVKEYKKEYYKKNADKIKAKVKKWKEEKRTQG